MRQINKTLLMDNVVCRRQITCGFLPVAPRKPRRNKEETQHPEKLYGCLQHHALFPSVTRAAADFYILI
jgi:hypothetical protein